MAPGLPTNSAAHLLGRQPVAELLERSAAARVPLAVPLAEHTWQPAAGLGDLQRRHVGLRVRSRRWCSRRRVARGSRPGGREIAGELENDVVVVSIAAAEQVLEADNERAHAGLRYLGVCDAVRVPARWAHEESHAAAHADPEHEL